MNNKTYTMWSTGGKSRTKYFYTAFGETKSLADWCRDSRCKMGRTSLFARLNKGMTMEEALTIPVMIAPAKNPIKLGDKLSFTDASHIRELHKDHNFSVQKLADLYTGSEKRIKNIINNQSFVDENIPIKPTSARNNKQIIRVKYNNNLYSLTEICEMLGISQNTAFKWHKIDNNFENYIINNRSKIVWHIRNNYKKGVIGKANYIVYKISKSAYQRIISNNAYKAKSIWWK